MAVDSACAWLGGTGLAARVWRDGLDSKQRYLFDNTCVAAGTPILPGMGLQMCGPVLMRFGTDRQKEYFLPRILSGEHYWCQGFSEPQAGSDLAALRCRAVREGDVYVVNGSKLWTTHAHAADWIFLLVKTGTAGMKPQQSITFLLAPMTTPGISVRPIRSLSGEHEVNQVFLDSVRIPLENRVGAENDGWSIAKYLLGFERVGGSRSGRVESVLARTAKIAAHERCDGAPLSEDPEFQRGFTQLAMEQTVLAAVEAQILASLDTHSGAGDTAASTLKLLGSELLQRATAFAMEALGPYAIADQLSALLPAAGPSHAHGPTARYLNARAATIFGGSSQVQRNILARQLIDAGQ